MFYTHILPKHFGWRSAFEGRPKLARWFEALAADPAAARVLAEVQGGLDEWEAAGRWGKVNVTAHVANGAHKWAYP